MNTVNCVHIVSIKDLKLLPRITGIYMVLDSSLNVIYVGKALNIYERWNKGHHKLGDILAEHGTDVYIKWVELPEWLLNRAENAACSFYQPKHNLRTPPVV